jgi:hypothetical protein
MTKNINPARIEAYMRSTILLVRKNVVKALSVAYAIASLLFFLYLQHTRFSDINALSKVSFWEIFLVCLLIGCIYAFLSFFILGKIGEENRIAAFTNMHRPLFLFLLSPLATFCGVRNVYFSLILCSFYFSLYRYLPFKHPGKFDIAPLSAEPDEEQLHEYKTELASILAISGIILTIAGSLLLLSKLFKPDTQGYLDRAAKILRPYLLSGVNPEPVEHAAYLLGCALIPAVTAFWVVITKKLMVKFKAATIAFVYPICAVFFLNALLILAIVDFNRTSYDYLQNIASHRAWFYLFIMVPAMTMLTMLINRGDLRKSRVLNDCAWFVLISTIFVPLFFMNAFSVNSSGGPNLNATIYALSQAIHGKTLLVDLASQYGMYPHFLEPIFRVFGLSVLSFSAVMSFINVASFALAAIALRKSIKNTLIWMLTSVSIAYISCFLVLDISERYIYFGYFPIRLFVPMVTLFLVVLYVDKPKKVLRYAIWALTSFGIFWNTDTGVVAYGSWLALLLYDSFCKTTWRDRLRSIIRTLATGMATLGFAIICVSAFLWIHSGQLPDFSTFLLYQTIFSSFGFFMIPMKLLSPWNLFILVYCFGLFYPFARAFNGGSTARSRISLFISILGFGLFSYYQGRSHDLVLPAVIYPSIMLIGLFADSLIAKLSAQNRKPLPLYVVLIIFVSILSFPAYNYFLNYKRVFHDVDIGVKSFSDPHTSSIDRQISFLKTWIKPNEQVLILIDDNEGLFYTETNTSNFLPLPSTTELMLESDMARRWEGIKNNHAYKVIVDAKYENMYMEVLSNRYKVLASDNVGIKIYVPR